MFLITDYGRFRGAVAQLGKTTGLRSTPYFRSNRDHTPASLAHGYSQRRPEAVRLERRDKPKFASGHPGQSSHSS